MHLALVFVDVLDGDDAAGDFAVEIDDRGGSQAYPCSGAIVVIAKVLSRGDGLSVHDGFGEWFFLRLVRSAAGIVCAGLSTIVVDQGRRRDDGAKNIVCAGIAHDDVTIGGVGDDDTDGGRFEDGLEAGFAAAQSFVGSFVVVDVFEVAVPADDFAFFVPSRGSANPHPPPFAIAAADAVFNVEELAGTKGSFPGSEGCLTIVGVKGADPACSQ